MGWGKYFMLRIGVSENVRGVRGHVRRIAKWDGHDYVVERELIAPIPLRWPRQQDALAINMTPNFEHEMTFVLNQSHNPGVLFSTDSYEPQGVPFGLDIGRYEVEVVIDAEQEGVPACVVSLVVDVPDEWDMLNVGVAGSPMPENRRCPEDLRPWSPPQPSPAPPDVPYTGGTISYPPPTNS